MSWRVARSLDVLLAEVNTRWPGRPRISDGSIGDASHQSRTSDHNAWVLPPDGGIVTARDITEWLLPGESLNSTVAEHLRARRDPRVKYVISHGRMFSSYATSTRKAWEWGPYTGENAHAHHMHVSVQPAPGLYDSPLPWGLLSPAILPPAPVEDTVSPEDKADIINGVTANLLAKIQPEGGASVGDELDRIRRGVRALVEHEGLAVENGP